MKLVLIAVFAALTFGQDAKVASSPAPPAAVQSERPLTNEESLEVENAMVHISLLNKEYKIDDYQKELSPYASTQDKVLSAACLSVGVPQEKLRTECGIAGFGPDGKQMTGQDGKPVPRRVWWNKPTLVSATDALNVKPATAEKK